MARAYPLSDLSDPANEPQPGEWQALRGELVALLDQVEDRYARTERPEPQMSGLAQRVRNLREQVGGPEPAVRRREALRTVKRAVDRLSEREDTGYDGEPDALTSAIAEIRGRQMSAPAAALGRRATDMPEFRDLTSLVGGLSGRLERLEVELKSQRASNGSVREVASQVEQLTHVVELLAGAVGETGQVKRLEAQIGALAVMIEEAPKVDLSTVNNRLDDMAVTVSKLAELQAQQMEREVVREERKAAGGDDGAAKLAPAMQAIEHSVRNVYDRIDAIEKNVALSGGDFERLTSEMAAFTQAMKEHDAAPNLLVRRVEDLAAQIGSFDTANGDVAGLKQDISALRDAVMSGMEPRFLRIESQIEALSERVAPADTGQVESQLKQLMARMDDAGAQLDTLAKLYSSKADSTDLEAMATLVAERTSEAVTRKAPAPVAMFGPDSLKSIEDRLTGLIRSAGKTPDYDALATLVAEKTSEAFSKAAPAPSGISEDSMSALEKRMTALFNTAGKDTAERLTRLEAVLSGKQNAVSEPKPVAAATPAVTKPAEATERPAETRLETMLQALAAPSAKADAMPANPADEAPLVDAGFEPAPVRSALEAKLGTRPATIASPEPVRSEKPTFDAATVDRPPRPQSSFASSEPDPFSDPVLPKAAPVVDAPTAQTSTSTFVAAARRAQRARQESAAPAVGNSAIGRAFARFRPNPANPADPAPVADVVEPAVVAEKPAKPIKEKKAKAPKPEAIVEPTLASMDAADGAPAGDQQSFLTRHRRPLLLTGALIVVSMLALNLVLQRMGPAPASTPAPATAAPAETPATAPTPTASDDVSLVAPQPRVIDMIDSTATGSIGPVPSALSFAKSTAMPGPVSQLSGTPVAAGIAADETPVTPEPFELPPEAIGPTELRQAAADGDARAQFEIGAIYSEGRAVAQDYAEAAKWYERAAAQGFVPAQYRLGNLYEAGQGVEQDMEQARLWYQRGAEAGNRMAMHNLAALYAGGQLGDQQFETAAEWFTKAADFGMTDSQFNLGMLYARGLGVAQDFEQSYKWFSLAARSGDGDASKARDDIAKSLSAEAVGRVDAELGSWTATLIDLAANFAPLGTWSSTFDPGETITTRDVIAKVQIALAKLGFDAGTPDGVAGPKTAEAIKAFERGTGMTELGQINPRLLAVLGSQPV